MIDVADQLLLDRCILVVEDDALVGIGLVDCLNEFGASVTWSSTVKDALHSLVQFAKLDAAIVDLNLHGVLSNDVLDELVKRDITTILCTGYDTSMIEERFRHLPCAAKPFTRAKLRSFLVQHLLAVPV